MITILPRSQGNVLGVKLHQKVTKQDYQTLLIPALDRILEEHKTARLLCEFAEDFKGYQFHAIFEDIRYSFTHLKQFKKFAVINCPLLFRPFLPIINALTSCESRAFAKHEEKEAWDFIES